MASVLPLGEHIDLFKDDQSYQQFLTRLRKATEKGIAVVIATDDVVGAVISAEWTRAILEEQLGRAINANPSLVREILGEL
jgi:ribonucleotide reductase beta subunit family protein with ferritin-like domain